MIYLISTVNVLVTHLNNYSKIHIIIIKYSKINLMVLCFSVSGPEYWGRINPEWSLCNKGRRQSPINVEPSKLLFDPFLSHIDVDKVKVSTQQYKLLYLKKFCVIRWKILK